MNRLSRLAIAILLCSPVHSYAVDITGCDQEVPAGQVGVLTTDLDCSADQSAESYGVELGRNAKLDMQGHTITGPRWAVYCPGPGGTCTVISTGNAGTLTGAEAGVWCPSSRITVSNVRFVGNQYGISNNPKTSLTDVTFVDNGFALTTRSLRATNVTATGSCNGYCFDIAKGRIDGLLTSDTGPSATVIQVAKTIRLNGASMSGSAEQVGILATTIKATNSAVTGHGVDFASRSLRVLAVSCDHSLRFDRSGSPIGSWGICAGD